MRRLLFVVAVFLLLLPFALRLPNNPTLAGQEGYFHARISLVSDGFNFMDPSVAGGSTEVVGAFHFLQRLSVELFGESALFFLSLIFAIASVLLFSILLDEFKFSKSIKSWSLLAYILSPLLLSVGFLNTPRSLIICLIFSAVLLTRRDRLVGAGIFFTLAALSGGVFSTVLTIFFLCALRPRLLKFGLAQVIVSLSLYFFGFTSRVVHSSGLISDFGAVYGLSVFSVILSFIGGVFVWKKSPKLLYLTPIVVFLFPETILVANALVSYLAGVVLSELSLKKWNLQFMRDATMVVLLCSLLFSSIAASTELTRLPPRADFFELVDVPRGVFVTDRDYGFWVQAKGHKTLADPRDYGVTEASQDLSRILLSANLDKTMALLERYDVEYILISDEMTQGKVWSRENKGLHFLVENSENFKRADEAKGFVLYEVV